MTTIAELRADLVADLELTGYAVYPGWKEKLTVKLPGMFVVPPQDLPYIEGGETFGESRIRFDITVLTMVGNRSETDALAEVEEMVQAVLNLNSDWLANGPTVDAPGVVTDNGVSFMGAMIHLSKYTKIGN